jgi:glycosyltransferase involved in cell wall biosynthesis
MKPLLSIIIPALNEEKHLPRLLNSIKKQKFPCEVIVADAGSKDNTVKIAKKFGVRVIKGGMPAKARNNGAKAASCELLLFLDSDVKLPKAFLEFCYHEIKSKNLGTATCYAQAMGNNLTDAMNYDAANLWIETFKKIKPYAHGFCIFSTKKIHKKIRGFDESITFGEDSDYVNRASKVGNFEVIDKKIFASVRRFKKEGRFKMALKYSYLNIYRLLIGEIRGDIDYDMSKH